MSDHDLVTTLAKITEDALSEQPDWEVIALQALLLAKLSIETQTAPCTAVSREGYSCDRTGPHDTHTNLMDCGATATWTDARVT